MKHFIHIRNQFIKLIFTGLVLINYNCIYGIAKGDGYAYSSNALTFNQNESIQDEFAYAYFVNKQKGFVSLNLVQENERINTVNFIESSSMTNTYILNSSTNGTTVSACEGYFVDSGNVGGNYSNNQNNAITFCSNTGDVLTFEFNTWGVENHGNCNLDRFSIFDGSSTSSLLIGHYCTNSPGIVSSTGTCITFRFTTNSSVTDIGWNASFYCGLPPIASCPESNCDDAVFLWEQGGNVGSVWTKGDEINNYVIPHASGNVNVTVELIDPFNRSGDDDLHDPGSHPFDPSGGCDNAAGSCNSGSDSVPGEGSISDPWDSDCDMLMTETRGGYGPGYLTFGIKTETSDEVVTFKYTFSKPVLICDFKVADIDYAGFMHSYNNACDEETPGDSYQDVVSFTASGPTGNVPLILTINYSGALYLDTPNQTVYANYNTNLSGNISPNNPDGEVIVSSNLAITELYVNYFNGPADKLDEQNNPSLYSWWSNSHGATSGVSDDQGVRLDGVQFCVCPDFIISPISEQICIGESANINFSVTGGIAPYEIFVDGNQLTGMTFSASPSQTTTYNLVIIDSAGCITEEEFTIYVNSNPGVNAFYDVACYGGSLNLYEDFGDADFWNWSGPNSFSSSVQNPVITNVTNLNSGTYYLTVTTSNGCTSTDQINVSIPSSLSCTTTVIQNVSCNGGNNGQSSASASGGTSPYSYNWGGSNPNALSAGTYTVTVTDVNGCTSTCSVTVNQPSSLSCTTTVIQNVSCNGGTNGQASVSASGGTSPYNYNWGGSNPSALSAGTYTVTVTDANGCTSTCSVTINQPSSLSCTTTVIQNVSCNGGTNGQASVSASGGTSPYSFNWGGSNPSALSAGTYTVTVTDANSCTSTCNVTINEPPLLTCAITKIQDVSCNGGTNGQASVSASGGTSPYSFNWGGSNPSALSAGTYTVTVTDANGCISTCAVTINQPSTLSCSTTVIQDVSCYGGGDGRASVSASGGTSPYNYNWGSATPNALIAGVYVVTVTDSNSCTSTCSVTIDEPPILTCTITKIQDVSCFGSSDGQASVSASGGTSPYNYNWGGSNPSALSAGTYTITVTDANGCTSSCSVTINEPSILECEITIINYISCNGCSDGVAEASGIGGVPPFSFDWGGANPNALGAGSYVVTVYDSNSCSSECYLLMSEPDELNCDVTVSASISCYGETTSVSPMVSGGVEPYTYNWGGADPDNLGSGSYTLTVTDANSVECSTTFFIDEPPLLTCSITKIKDVSCYGGSDGQASVSASGGTNPYSFDWGGADPNALMVGTYVVTVTDTNSCTSTCSVTIDEPPLLTCSITKIQDVSCYGGSDGQASVSASGGVSPYSFDWGGPDPNALVMGTYVVTVTDTNLCTSTCSVTIDEPPLLTCLITKIQDVSCYGGNNGQASVIASGGVSPYSFDWGGADANALVMGTYVVTVTDTNSCTSTCSVTIDEPPLLTCLITKIQDVSCYGGNDGQASVSASGGVSPYSFDWGGADPNALMVGTYVVIVTDTNSCTSTCSVTLDEPPLLTCMITKIQDVTCYGGSDGQASVSASGGVSPYSFNWGGADANALMVGTYVVTVTDTNSCTSTCSVTIDEPPLLTCMITKIQDVTCYGGSDGQASVNASGGVSPYSYDWGGVDPNALSVGTYTVTVTDTNSCTSTCSVTIDEPPLLTCSISKIQDVSCYGGNDGQASVSASGGVSPYSYDWGGVAPNTLSVGTYTVTVTDTNSCTSTCSVTIDEPPLLTCSISKIQDVSCYGGNDGQASVSASGGVSPYSFDWGVADPNALVMGTYTVTVTDTNSCTSTCSVTIDEPPLLTCAITKIQDVSCYGGNDGQASVSASGGVSPYSYDWGGADPNALIAGTYVVTVTDTNSCTSTCSVTIDEPPLLTCAITKIQDVSCYGGSDGQASVSASGGVSPYSYDWGGADPNALVIGTYVVTVTDTNSCTSTCSVTINEPPLLTCLITKIQDVSCYSGNDGQASVSASGGVIPYSFDWGGVDPNALITGTYVVTVTDTNSCTSTCSVTIDEPPLLTCMITKIQDVSCYGGSDGQANVSASGGVSPYSFDWGGYDPNSLIAGTYVVTVTDTNSCTSTCSVTIDEPPLLTCMITKIQDVSCYGGNDGQASVSASGGVSPYSFDWGGADPNSLVMGTYVVTVTDTNSCTSTCSVTIDEPPLLTCAITKIEDVSCYGGNNGQASVSASGGVSPYSFDWGGADPNALIVGTYTVTVTDTNSCTSTCSVTIDEPPLLTCLITKIQDVSCYGGNDGQASVSASGGVSPYSFDWGGYDPNALSVGTYVVTVTDTNSCASTCSVTIDEPPLLTCLITKIQDVSCFGGSDGQASVSASGGVSPYSFDWGGYDPNALVIGTYTVTVTDTNSCTSTCSVTIDEPPLLTCMITKIQDVSCYGGSDGQASVSASGGVSPYSFDWGGVDPNALVMGTYVVTVTDTNSCTSTCSVTIDEPPLLTCAISKIQDVSCYGGNDGQASVSASGGVSPYSFDWGGADPNALIVGTYVVTVTDSNLCTSTCSVTINEPPLLTCLITKIQDVSCYGGNDGQASVSASGGVSPYSFDWGGADPNALIAGTYIVTVTDANSCTSTCSVTIDEPPLLTCIITKIQDVSCYGGSDGQASVSASGGIIPYSFDWGGYDPNALSVGTYTVTVTDTNSCTSTCSVTIDEPPLLTCMITKIQDVSCYGGSDGQASVSASGGVSPYGFDWGGVDPNALVMGTYVVTVTDTNSCTSTCSVTIDEPPLLTCAISKIQDVSCYGGNDGQASVSASGGVSPYSFDWGGADPNALIVGTYVVTVTDSNLCTSTCSVTIDEPPLLTCAIIKIQDVSCYGGSDGQASVSASGGVSPYSYDWGGADPNALIAGTYIVTVTDANSCTSTCSVIIDEPPLLTCLITKIQDVSCFGGSDGQASVSAAGGVSPYSFDWGGYDPNALSVGTYTVTVTDTNSCTSTCSVTIDEPPLLTCMIAKIQDVSCYGGNDGQASVSASGGVSPYSYDWGGADPNALVIGTYVVTVTDTNSCSSTCSVTIDEPPLLTCMITKIQDVSCYGGSDGQASVSASGGVNPYSFDWGGHDPNALVMGTYVVTVTDTNSCTSTCSVTIDEPPLLTCLITKIQDVSCYGGNDGQASVSASGGVSPYSFDWGGVDPNALIAGTYIVTVTDANSCTSTCSVTIDEPPLLTCAITKIQDVSCFGGSDGQASVNASGGVSPYSFDWGGVDPNALVIGTYTVTVTDSNSCTSTCSVTIDEPPLLTCAITKIQDVSCYSGSDGQASVSASGGVSPYSFDWGGVDPNALVIGTYTVTITDTNSCTSTCSVTIDEPPLLTCMITKIQDVSCYGGSDGQASVSASGGVSPYSFDWGGVDPNSLIAGTYTVTVTDTNLCTSTCSVTIDEPPLLTCMITKIQDVSCYGGNDGQASVSASGGVSPYSFDWGGVDPNALIAGTYIVTVTDANSCTSTCSVTIDEPPLLTCLITKIQDVSCYGGSDGQASVNASGGVSPYSFDWGGVDPNALVIGTYTVTVTDSNLCTSTCSVTIDEPPLLSCSITKIQDVSCYSGSDGQASVSASGGVSPYSFDWGRYDPNALVIGTYTVTVTDANSCTSTCSVTIDEPPLLTCAITKIQDVSCYGGNNGQASVSASGGVSPYSFDWGGVDPNALLSGTYVVTVTDTNSCTSTCSVTIDEPPLLSCSITKIQDVSCYGGNDGQASVSASGGVSPYSFDWGGADPNALIAGTYVVTVTDINSCTSTCSVTIEEPPLLTCLITKIQDVSCYGGSDGQVSVSASGGVSPYSFDWGGVDPNALIAGTYTVTVTDANTCTSSCSVTINEYEPLSCNLVSIDHVDCYGSNSGVVNLTGTGGRMPYNVDWGAYDPDALYAGNYEVTITDANGCFVTCRIIVDEPTPLVCSLEITDESCVRSDGMIEVSVSGGVPPYRYSIDGGISFRTINIFDSLTPGQYDVIIEDSNGCQVICSGIVEPDCYDLAIEKQLISLGGFTPGNYLSYRLEIENQGTLWAYNTRIKDEPELGLNYLSSNAGDNSNVTELSDLEFEIASLAPGEVETIILNFRIDASFAGDSLLNKVQIIVDDGDDIDSDPNTDETIDEDGDGDGDDDDEDEVVIEVSNKIEIGDYVWLDRNGNGLQETGEPGISGIEVVLYNSRGLIVEKTRTDSIGYYLFVGINPGSYYVKFNYGSEYKSTLANRGSNDNIDSEIDNKNGAKTTKTYLIEVNNYSIDAGLLRCAELSGTVWYDINENDVHDSYENGINGMKVELYKQLFGEWVLWEVELTGLKPGTPSDDGYYSFCVDPGSYYLRFLNAPATLVTVIPFAGAEEISSKVTGRFGHGTTEEYALLSGDKIEHINAGYYPMGSIGDYIWLDSNDNGMRDEGEAGVANITVRAINTEGEIVSEVISNSLGEYKVDYLGKDDYYLEVELPWGMTFTEANVGEDEQMDSDIDGSNGEGTTQMMRIGPGIHLNDVNVGVLESVLPVDWLDFTGRKDGNKNHLEWIVDKELNVSHYEVERSEMNTFDFGKIAEVPYYESDENPKYYTYDDYAIETNTVYYYRIRQIDFNGSYDYSRIVSIQSDEFTFDEVKITMYPNPAHDRVMLKFDHYTNVDYGELMFINGSGEVIKKEILENVVLSPDRPMSFDISHFPEGVYSWILVISDFSIVDKLVILD